MAVRCTYTPPTRDLGVLLRVAVPLAEHAAAGVLLAASQDLVPVEEGVLKASGRTVDTATGVAVTYGRDDDGGEKHAPSNQYVVIVHEDLTAHHPNGGQAMFLSTPAHTERDAMFVAAAASLRKAL